MYCGVSLAHVRVRDCTCWSTRDICELESFSLLLTLAKETFDIKCEQCQSPPTTETEIRVSNWFEMSQ